MGAEAERLKVLNGSILPFIEGFLKSCNSDTFALTLN